jgi:tetratricopeptide (TPR) repeat protein
MSVVTKLSLLLGGVAAVCVLMPVDADAQSRRNRDRNAEQAPAQPANPTVSRPFATAFQPVNAAINANDLATADAGLPALQAAATTPYERYVAAQTEFRIASAQNNPARQLVALDAMIDSNGAPATEQARLYTAAGQLAYNARDYAKAASRFERALALGSTADNLSSLYVTSLIQSNQLDQGLAYARQQIAAGQSSGTAVSEQFLSIVARALQERNRTPELLEILGTRAVLYPTAQNLRSLGIIYLQSNPANSGLTLDVMRMLNEAGALDDRRLYVEYAQEASDANLPGEAVAVIRAGRTAGRIPQPDAFFDELYRSQNAETAEDRASLAGSARRAGTDPGARTATLTGDAYFGYGDYAEATRLYEMAKTKTDADLGLLNLRIGVARYRTGDLAGARQSFEAVQGQRQVIAQMWIGFIRQREAAASPAPAAPASTPAGTN